MFYSLDQLKMALFLPVTIFQFLLGCYCRWPTVILGFITVFALVPTLQSKKCSHRLVVFSADMFLMFRNYKKNPISIVNHCHSHFLVPFLFSFVLLLQPSVHISSHICSSINQLSLSDVLRSSLNIYLNILFSIKLQKIYNSYNTVASCIH